MMPHCAFCSSPLPAFGSHRCRGETVGFTGVSHDWRGRVRIGSDIIYECAEHGHRSRDQSSRTFGSSATDCARTWLRRVQAGG
jgi:hypothetical protein